LGAPFTLEATEDMLMMLPLPAASMPGRQARIVRYIEVTLRSNERSQSASEQSSSVPWCT
jgi:hypothetical protein